MKTSYCISTLLTVAITGCGGNIVKLDMKSNRQYIELSKKETPNNKYKKLFFNKKIYFTPIDTTLLENGFYSHFKKEFDEQFKNEWTKIFNKQCKIAKSVDFTENYDITLNMKVIKIRTESPFELFPVYAPGKRITVWIYATNKNNELIFNQKTAWNHDKPKDFLVLASNLCMQFNSEQ